MAMNQDLFSYPMGLKAGVNLGGWLSQYPAYDHIHFQSFIHETDLRQIASWGMDHVRLPVDYPVIEDESATGKLSESGKRYLLEGLSWAHDNGLKVILDLHKAPGYAFDALSESSMFGSRALQERFLRLWQELAELCKPVRDGLIFELLNEIVLPESAPWNSLAAEAVQTIRQVDEQRVLVIGGNYYNAADQLDKLELMEDPNILYTFHFYEPLPVTHQKCYWHAGLKEYDRALSYPGEATGLGDFLAAHPEHSGSLKPFVGQYFDKNWVRRALQPAVDFTRQTGKTVFCGEYGVIDRADSQTRRNWNRDLVAVLNETGIGHTYWSYKQMDFGLVGADGRVLDEKLVEIVSQ